MDNKTMNHGSLFSGIGGFDLAAEWMGWNNVFHCEWMPFPRKVLNYYWPKSISYEDITKTDFTIHKGTIDILTGGFPCQPYSAAGKRLGKDDERHLWPEMLRAIKEIEPRWVVGENVRGLTNWNGGVVFEEVCADLENCGYQIQPILLPACAVGAPHRRDRIWFIAYRNSNGFNQCDSEYEEQSSKRRFNAFDDINKNDVNGNASNSKFERLQSTTINGRLFDKEGKMVEKRNKSSIEPSSTNSKQIITDSKCLGWNEVGNDDGKFEKTQQKKCGKKQFGRTNSTQDWWRNFPSQSPICSGDDGLPTKLDTITFSKWRAESIKGYGNAVVPQLVFEIFKVIQHIDNEQT